MVLIGLMSIVIASGSNALAEATKMVEQDIQEAQNIGVRGVPFFVFNRKYAVSGAQPPQAFLQTLEQSYNEWRKENPEKKSSAASFKS